MARNCCVLAITQSPLATHFQASARRLNGSVGGALCRLIQQRVIENKVAGRQGFEPRYADPESAYRGSNPCLPATLFSTRC